MINIPFFNKAAGSFLGLDIGTSSIKMVEVSGNERSVTLENYGELFLRDFAGKAPTSKGTEGNLLYSSSEIAEAINHLVNEAGVKSRKAYFSIPDFVTFFTSFELPPMKEEEVSSAVEFHSRQYIPLPISEVVLDWSIDRNREDTKGIKINLIAVPKEVIEQYQEIARLAGIEILSLEGEMFSLVRALARDKPGIVAIADIGEQSTMLSIAENGTLKTTHSLEIAGSALVEQVAKKGEIEYNEARDMVMQHGMVEETVKKAISSMATSLFSEISRAVNTFEKNEGKAVEELIIAGGFSLLPGVVDFAEDAVEKKVVTQNCFEGVSYPEELEEVLKEISSSHAIALGSALNGVIKEEE